MRIKKYFPFKKKSEDKLGSYANDSGQWNVFYLFLHDMKFEENCKKCPITVSLIEKYVPRQYQYTFYNKVMRFSQQLHPEHT